MDHFFLEGYFSFSHLPSFCTHNIPFTTQYSLDCVYYRSWIFSTFWGPPPTKKSFSKQRRKKPLFVSRGLKSPQNNQTLESFLFTFSFCQLVPFSCLISLLG